VGGRWIRLRCAKGQRSATPCLSTPTVGPQDTTNGIIHLHSTMPHPAGCTAMAGGVALGHADGAMLAAVEKATGLAAKDTNGLSDPYVLVRTANRCRHPARAPGGPCTRSCRASLASAGQ
jgi:hypothetical protein